MSKRRVVITGIGVIAPNGIGKEEFWEALKKGQTGIRIISSFNHSIFSSHVAGEVLNFDAKAFMSIKVIRRTDRATHFAIAAASLALKDARLSLVEKLKEEMQIIIGTTMSGHISYIEQLSVYSAKGPQKVSPFAAVSCFPDACSGQLAIFFGFKGPSETICAGCAASTNAVIDAYRRITHGDADICIAGGTDAPLREEIFCGFCQAKVLSQKDKKTPAPFDKHRDGTVLSEGAGIVIVEELTRALARNAPIYGEIIGSGMTTDAYQMAGSEPTGRERVRAMKIALKNAGIVPEEVEYINAHGTGTVMNDVSETRAIKEVFGKYAYKIPISATKSMIGHTQGASGVLEVVATLQALKGNVIHPTINYHTRDEDCDLDYVPNEAILKRVNVAVSNSFAFGGKNSIIVLKRFDG